MTVTIRDFNEKSKSLVRRVLENRELFSAILIVVVGVISFGLGRLSVQTRDTLPQQRSSFAANTASAGVVDTAGQEATQPTNVASGNGEIIDAAQAPSGEKKYVASKNSTKYHLPWCSGAARIAEENKVWFSSKEEAAAAGYTPAANCKGI